MNDARQICELRDSIGELHNDGASEESLPGYQAGYQAGLAIGRQAGYRQGYRDGFSDAGSHGNAGTPPAATSHTEYSGRRLLGLPCVNCGCCSYSDETCCPCCKTPRGESCVETMAPEEVTDQPEPIPSE
jgi:hypothetical protein